MKKNLVSPRTEYLSFKYEEAFEETPYFKAMQNKVKKRTVLILSKSRGASLKRVTKIVNALKDSKMTVYVREYFKDDFKNVSYVKAVKKDSTEYYNALATAQYIYTDTFLYADFIKRRGQVVINHINSAATDARSRINITSAANKTDWFIGSEGENSISFSDFLKALAKRSLKNSKFKSAKTKLLFVVNMEYIDSLYNAFSNSVQWMDLEKYDITLLVDWKYVDEYSHKFEKLDPKIHLLAKKGKILTDSETNKRLAFLKNEYNFITNPKKINAFLPKDVFKNECLRVFGTTDYDIVFNLKYDVFYWRWLIETLGGKKITVDMNNYQSTASNLGGKAFYVGLNDSILFLNKDSMDKALNFNKKIFEGKSTLIDYVPFCQNNPEKEQEAFEIDSKRYFIVSQKSIRGLDTISITALPEVDENIPYIVLDNHFSAEEALDYVKALSAKAGELFVFDFFGVFTNTELNAIRNEKDIHYFSSPDIYYPLLYKLGSCLCINDGMNGVIHEAVKMNKKVVFLDKELNVIEKEATPNYHLPKSNI